MRAAKVLRMASFICSLLILYATVCTFFSDLTLSGLNTEEGGIPFTEAQIKIISPQFIVKENKNDPLDASNWTMLDIRRGHRNSKIHNLELDLTPLHPSQWQHLSEIHPSSFNVTTNTNVLVYNRVPKCASTTVLALLKKLSKQNNFSLLSSKIYWKKVLDVREQKDLVSFLAAPTEPVAFDRHFYTLDWGKLGLVPTLVNMVREPIDRVISGFYYLRSHRRWVGKKDLPPLSWFTKKFDKCVLSGDKECSVGEGGGQEMQLTYFCGSQAECSNATSWGALQLAKYNVEKRYSVVGVMERLNTSLAVMEKFLPRWFQGARHLLPEQRKNKNKHPKVNEKVRQFIGKALNNEVDFYQFVNQRLSFQEEMLKEKKMLD